MLASTSSVRPPIENGWRSCVSSRHGDPARLLAAGRVGQQDAELVAAEPRDHVLLSEGRAQALGHLLQQAVAGVVAERVVDLLEVIEVDQHHGRRAADVDDPLGLMAEERSVRQPGERVVHRLVLRRDRLPPAVVDGQQGQEQQRHRRESEVGGEGDDRGEAEHQPARGQLEEQVLGHEAADPDVLCQGDDDRDQSEVDEEEHRCGDEDARQVVRREMKRLPHAWDAGERAQHHCGHGDRDRVLRRIEEQLGGGLAPDQVSDAAGADEDDHGTRRAGDQQRGERKRRRCRHLSLGAAPDDLQRDQLARERTGREQHDLRGEEPGKAVAALREDRRAARHAEEDHPGDVDIQRRKPGGERTQSWPSMLIGGHEREPEQLDVCWRA